MQTAPINIEPGVDIEEENQSRTAKQCTKVLNQNLNCDFSKLINCCILAAISHDKEC